MNPKRYQTLRVIVREHGATNPAWAACGELLAELDRMRAAVKKIGDRNQTHHHVYGDDLWVKVDEVLAALEAPGE